MSSDKTTILASVSGNYFQYINRCLKEKHGNSKIKHVKIKKTDDGYKHEIVVITPNEGTHLYTGVVCTKTGRIDISHDGAHSSTLKEMRELVIYLSGLVTVLKERDKKIASDMTNILQSL